MLSGDEATEAGMQPVLPALPVKKGEMDSEGEKQPWERPRSAPKVKRIILWAEGPAFVQKHSDG